MKISAKEFPFRRTPLALAVSTAIIASAAPPIAVACTPSGSFLTVTVDTLVDVTDPEDGLTTLREAVEQTNDNPGCDLVRFDASLNGGTLQWSSGNPSSSYIRVLNDDLRIEGPGSGLLTLDLSVDTGPENPSTTYPTLNGSGADLTISGLTISGSSYGNVGISGGSLTLDDIVSTGGNRGVYATSTPDSLTIRNSTISGNQAFDGGGIQIFSAATVRIEDSEISDNVADNSGGGIYYSASSGTPVIEIVNSVVSGNHAEAASNGSGGGIHVSAFEIDTTLTLSGTTVDDNTTGRDGGGIFFAGSSASLQTLIIEDSVVSANTANLADGADEGPVTNFSGGGIYLSAPSVALTIVRSGIRDNLSSSGGGIDMVATGGSFDLVITDSTISGNTADDSSSGAHGGGMRVNGGGTASGVVLITQSTFSGNNADEGQGGIYLSSLANLGAVEIRHSTITNNTSNQSQTGVGVNTGGATPVLWHTVVAGNGSGSDLSASTYDADYSLIGNATGATLNGGNNVTDIDPANLGLGPLVDSPGPAPTQVHMPASNSPVVDAGDPDLEAGEGETPAFDQSGRPRIVNGIVDIGAVEFNANQAPQLDEPIDSVTVRTGQAFEIDLLDYFSDPDSDELTFEILNPGEIPDAVDLTGSIVSGTFTADDVGTYIIGYRVCDTEPLCTEGSGELVIVRAGGGGGGLGGVSLAALLSLYGLRRLNGRRGRLSPRRR